MVKEGTADGFGTVSRSTGTPPSSPKSERRGSIKPTVALTPKLTIKGSFLKGAVEDRVQWLFFYGDPGVGVNTLLSYYAGQSSLSDLLQYEPLTFIQTDTIETNLKEEGTYHVLCTSHAGICASRDIHVRQALYDQAYVADMAVVVYDITSRTSFLNAIRTYIPEIQKTHPHLPVTLLGLGLEKRRIQQASCVSSRELKMVLDALDLTHFFECDSVSAQSPFNQIVIGLNQAMKNAIKERRQRLAGSPAQSPTTDRATATLKRERKERRSLIRSITGKDRTELKVLNKAG